MIENDHLSDWSASQDSNHSLDHYQSRDVTPEFKLLSHLCHLKRYVVTYITITIIVFDRRHIVDVIIQSGRVNDVSGY